MKIKFETPAEVPAARSRVVEIPALTEALNNCPQGQSFTLKNADAELSVIRSHAAKVMRAEPTKNFLIRQNADKTATTVYAVAPAAKA